MKGKKVLASCYVIQVKKGYFDAESLVDALNVNEDRIRNFLSHALSHDFINTIKGDKFILTDKGRKLFKVIFTAGSYDIIHIGHIATLEAAKKLGDVLTVVVARDDTIRKIKGREPVIPEEHRVILLNKIKPVDLAILGSKKSWIDSVEKVKPDIIALGKDQKIDASELKEKLLERSLDPEIVRLNTWINDELAKTTNIIKKIKNLNTSL
ncbi:MAG: adenylyltransferase/cytidyltransferase family protein [Candidatus Odinarchaeia archaeon]